MPKTQIYPLIFTDLDGTLLDHESYSPRPADTLIKQLHDANIARVMPVTSKTQAELKWLDRAVSFNGSVKISENGSVIHAPHGFPFSGQHTPKTLVLGVAYQTILSAVAALPDHLRQNISGFADMDAAAVARRTGLPLEDAVRAKERQATEPFLWSGTLTEMDELKQKMAEAGIKIQQGGRFFHFTGAATKEQAVERVTSAYRKNEQERTYVTIALGDGPNDLNMIEAADYGVIIPNANGAAVHSGLPSVHTAEKPGPESWVLSVTQILQELGLL